MRNPLSGLGRAIRDPFTRSRLIIWGLVAGMAFFGILGASQYITSTPWFCNEVCHNVHDDNAAAYMAGTHENVNCVACHYHVNMNPVAFMLDRADKLLDIPPTITGDFHMPINGVSHYAAAFPSEQCTQCHNMENRTVSTSAGLIIDHEKHAEAGVNCAQCHNRVAHPEEDIELTLPGNEKKENWMEMTACFRCHTQDELVAEGEAEGEVQEAAEEGTGEGAEHASSELVGPGACEACHTVDFNLVPESHETENWYQNRGDSAGHAEAAREEASQTAEAVAEWEEIRPEVEGREPRILARLAGVSFTPIVHLDPAETVNECYTCHSEQFCIDCHGTEIPHQQDFKDTHGERFEVADAASCGKCHNQTGTAANDALSCSLCHHPGSTPPRPWRTQHDEIALEGDISADCYPCHNELFCSSCHVRGEPATPY